MVSLGVFRDARMGIKFCCPFYKPRASMVVCIPLGLLVPCLGTGVLSMGTGVCFYVVNRLAV